MVHLAIGEVRTLVKKRRFLYRIMIELSLMSE